MPRESRRIAGFHIPKPIPVTTKFPEKPAGEKPPRLIVVPEGQMECAGIHMLVNAIVRWKKMKFQVLKRNYRIHGGGTVSVEKLASDLRKIAHVLRQKGEAECVCALVDLEDRSITWDSFVAQCRACVKMQCVGFAVACTATEAWILADIEGAVRALRPTKMQPKQHAYLHTDTIGHPPEQELKKYWPDYHKVKHGSRFLSSIRPEEVQVRSQSFKAFVAELQRLHKDYLDGSCN